MEAYLRHNRLSELMDSLGARALIYLLATLWFVYLWGLGWPALLAGLALGTLGVMARARLRQRSVARREKALRRRLGGELMLEEMLLSGAKEAHFRAALLLGERWPLVMCQANETGVVCRQGEETLLVMCLRMPPEGELSVGDLMACQRALRAEKADRGVACVLGRVSPKVAARAEQLAVPLRIIRRETLLDIAGRLCPATDAQLVALGQRRRRTARGSLLSVILQRQKAKRYFLYGVTLLILYILTGGGLYAVPGAVCLTMAVLCRTDRGAEEAL